MKEKIWIEKLVELLNEYEDVIRWYASYTIRGNKSKREIKSDYMFDEDQNIIQLYIISKSYWFIEWLVENDKIDLDACEWEKTYNNLTASRDSNYSQYERLLMALAIQDEPIRFLCEILK
jgi:hypothetical protein